MDRLFYTHNVRESKEIEGLWNFQALTQSEHQILKVVVPSCWETYPGYENYRGKAVYTKEIQAGGNVRLLFKGVSHSAEVYFDEELVTSHYNAYTPFSAVIPSVTPGRHSLKVVVDNSYNEESALHMVNDYFTYGGINRPVILEQVEDTYIDTIHFTPARQEESWYADVEFYVWHIPQNDDHVSVEYELDDQIYQLGEVIVQHGMNHFKKRFHFHGIEQYQPENPRLYKIHGRIIRKNLVIDDLIDRVGFRTIEIDGSQILMNGKKISIQGFNRHEDHGLFGSAIPLEVMDNDLALMMDMGANAVRTCHYPNDERFIDLCDEKGILVWEEGHARGLNEEQMRHKNFRKQSLDCIREMIYHHYNHPAIFVWGILNECASNTEYGRDCYKEQFQLIRSMDQSRPTTFASCQYRSDICLDLPDIVSMNIYPLWYHDSPAISYVNEVYEWIETTKGKGKPVIISEIGAGGIYGYRANSNPKWSEDRQADIIRQQLEAVKENKNIVGTFLWQFADCRVPDECFYGRPRCNNNKGVVDEFRRKKQSYHIVKQLYKS